MKNENQDQGQRWVFQYKHGVLDKKVIAGGETPEGWHDLIRDAKANPEELRGVLSNTGSKTIEGGEASPVADLKGEALKEEIAKITDVPTLEKIVMLDSRVGAKAAANARLAELAAE